MTEADVVVHEVAHYYTDLLSRLENRGQSGAISEAYSDMAGTLHLAVFVILI